MKLVPEELPPLRPEQVAEAAEILRLLGEPSRLRILLACLVEPAPVGALAARVAIPRSLVSHHLCLLRASRLLRAERRGKEMIYAPRDERVRCIVVDLARHVLGLEGEPDEGEEAADGSER
jgi:DNA-binding transcriptional ArsR family regulator